MTVVQKIRQTLSLDLRSLALFRIGVASLIIADLLVRSRSLTAHYTDQGVLPRALHTEIFDAPWYFSLHLINGSWTGQALLFLLAGGLALMLLAGYRTRVATVLSWLMMVSLHNRNYILLNSGDFYLRMLLFWGIFLPLGARFSLDRALATRAVPEEDEVFLPGGAALIIQILSVYIFSGFFKCQEPSWKNGLALYYAFSSGIFATPLALWLSRFRGLLALATPVVLATELCGPWLVLVPWRNPAFRIAAIAIFISFHVTCFFLLSIGLFSPIGIVAWTVLLPAVFWNRLGGVLGTLPRCAASFATKVLRRLPRHPRPVVYGTSRLSGVAAALLSIYVFFWNVGTLPDSRFRMPELLASAGYFARLDQSWQMFAQPIIDDGWFVVAGRLADGETLDLFKPGHQLSWDRPALVSGTFPTDRWRKYMLTLYNEDSNDFRLGYGRYLCGRWNDRHFGRTALETLEVIYMRQDILPGGGRRPAKKTVLWNHVCFDSTSSDQSD